MAARACRKSVNMLVEEMICSPICPSACIRASATAPTTRLEAPRRRGAEGALSAEAGDGELDRHDVPDRAAMRHRPRPDPHQGRARSGDGTLPITGTKIFISAGEHDLDRQHRPPRAGAAARRARRARGASACSWCRNSCPSADGSAGARNGVTCGAHRAQDGHQGLGHLRA